MAYKPPKEPDHTCPLINKVLSWLSEFDVDTDFDEMTITQFRTFVNHLDENRAWVVEKMEEIRSANDALRQRSHYFEENYEKASSELSDREGELEDALKELADLRQQLDGV